MKLTGLDDPIWAALTTEHAGFAQGSSLAKRYAPDVSPFAGVVGQSEAAGVALRALVLTDGRVALFAPDTIAPPPGLEIERTAGLEQMIATQEPQAEAPATDICDLSHADATEMQALVVTTNPRPLGPRPHIPGRFLGLRPHTQPVALPGERLA